MIYYLLFYNCLFLLLYSMLKDGPCYHHNIEQDGPNLVTGKNFNYYISGMESLTDFALLASAICEGKYVTLKQWWAGFQLQVQIQKIILIGLVPQTY